MSLPWRQWPLSGMVASCLTTIALTLLIAACSEKPRSGETLAGMNDTAKLHDDMTLKVAGNPDPSERIQFPQFSIVAPQGERWVERRMPEPPSNYAGFVTRVMFVKLLPQHAEGPHTVIASVSLVSLLDPAEKVSVITNPREYMQFRMKWEVDTLKLGSGRMRVKSIDAKIDESLGVCYRVDVEFEDRGVYGFPNTAFILDAHEYQCADPAAKYIAKIEYSQRRPPEAEPFDLSREGEGFLKSFMFAEPKQG